MTLLVIPARTGARSRFETAPNRHPATTFGWNQRQAVTCLRVHSIESVASVGGTPSQAVLIAVSSPTGTPWGAGLGAFVIECPERSESSRQVGTVAFRKGSRSVATSSDEQVSIRPDVPKPTSLWVESECIDQSHLCNPSVMKQEHSQHGKHGKQG